MKRSSTRRKAPHPEVRSAILKAKPAISRETSARYHGAIGIPARKTDEQSLLEFYGLKVPQIEEFSRKTWSFSHLPPEKQLKIWNDIFIKSDLYEELCIALRWFGHDKQKDLRLKNWPTLLRWLRRVDNWPLSDMMSDLFSEALEYAPHKYWKHYLKWNKSKNPWERRQSLVGIYNYARFRKKPLPAAQVLPLIKRLVGDPHFYVQRGVGWTLRELYHVDPKAQLKFVVTHAPQLSAIAFATAIEKYSSSERRRAVQARKSR